MPQKQMISAEEKVRIVTGYLKGEVGFAEAARNAGCNIVTFKEWVKQYQMEGLEAFLPHGRNRTYSPELKKKAVLDYLSGLGSFMEVGKKYGIRNSRQLKDWVKMYNAHGDFNSVKQTGGGSYMKQGRETTFEERIQIVQECIGNGKSYGEMVLKYIVSYQQVRSWTLRFEKMGEAGLQDRRGCRKKDQTPRTELEQAQIEIEQLKHKLYLAEMENALLKKLDEVERRDASQK